MSVHPGSEGEVRGEGGGGGGKGVSIWLCNMHAVRFIKCRGDGPFRPLFAHTFRSYYTTDAPFPPPWAMAHCMGLDANPVPSTWYPFLDVFPSNRRCRSSGSARMIRHWQCPSVPDSQTWDDGTIDMMIHLLDSETSPDESSQTE